MEIPTSINELRAVKILLREAYYSASSNEKFREHHRLSDKDMDLISNFRTKVEVILKNHR